MIISSAAQGVNTRDQYKRRKKNSPYNATKMEDHKAQEMGNAAKEKINDAGRAVRNTAEKVADKAGELKDKAKQKIQEGADSMKSH
ncbi:hypothetical protein GCK32_019536 [Trichostrongylus colubriformis]|uniref:Uncharacterized protein n=1 Tax=Trichostrongylus colubriformis TaxID=6319 RepID=A0AAN8GCG0_TRICO